MTQSQLMQGTAATVDDVKMELVLRKINCLLQNFSAFCGNERSNGLGVESADTS